MDKRGQVNTIPPAVIALIVAGVFLVLGLVMLQEIRDTDVVSSVNTLTTQNETLTTVTETGETLANNELPAAVCTITLVTNATGGETIAAANYTQTNCVLVSAAGGTYNNSNWNVTYDTGYGDQAYTGGNTTVVGLGTFADFWEIIVLAIVISVVIGLLLTVFGRRVRR